MSVPMVELAHVETLWARSVDPAEREADLAALRESAVPGADANETAVILPAGWCVREAKIETHDGRYIIGKCYSEAQGYIVRRAYDNFVIGVDGQFFSCFGVGAREFPTPQAAIDALARALEGEAQ